MAWVEQQTHESVANTEGGARVRVTPGEYLGVIQSVTASKEPDDAADAEKAYFQATMLLEDGPEKGRKISEFFRPFGKGAFKLGGWWKALGGDPAVVNRKYADYKAFARFAAALSEKTRGKKIGMLIDDNEYQGKVSSQVAEFYPAGDFANRSRFNTPAAAQSVSSNGEETLEDLGMNVTL